MRLLLAIEIDMGFVGHAFCEAAEKRISLMMNKRTEIKCVAT